MIFKITGDDVEVEGLLPEEETTTYSSDADTVSSDSTESDEFWTPFIGSPLPVDNVVKENNGSVPSQAHIPELEKDVKDSIETTDSKPKSSKPVKRNKWSNQEVKKLIKMRGELHSKFLVVKRKMALWEEISKELLAGGINRSPGQCKSRWASLVQEYEVCCPSLKSKNLILILPLGSDVCFLLLIFLYFSFLLFDYASQISSLSAGNQEWK